MQRWKIETVCNIKDGDVGDSYSLTGKLIHRLGDNGGKTSGLPYIYMEDPGRNIVFGFK